MCNMAKQNPELERIINMSNIVNQEPGQPWTGPDLPLPEQPWTPPEQPPIQIPVPPPPKTGTDPELPQPEDV